MLVRLPGMPRSRKTSNVAARSSARPRLFVCRGVSASGALLAVGLAALMLAPSARTGRPAVRVRPLTARTHRLAFAHADGNRESGMGRPERVGTRAGRSTSARNMPNPGVSGGIVADTPADCRMGCRFAASFRGANGNRGGRLRPANAGVCTVFGPMLVWRQKRIRQGAWTCARRGRWSRCGLFLHVPIWHSRVVADPSSSSRSAAPALDRTRPRLRRGQHPRPGGTTRC